MSAAESDEPVKLIESEELNHVHHVNVDATPIHAEENIPNGSTHEHAHSHEEPVTTNLSAEDAAAELSSDDTHGKTIPTEHKQDAFAAEVPSSIPDDSNRAHSESIRDDEVEPEAVVYSLTGPQHDVIEEEVPASASSDIDSISAPTEVTPTASHEIETNPLDSASGVAVTDELKDVYALIGNGNGTPIMLRENALEVCEAEPETMVAAEELAVLKENALEVCEAEPETAPSPKIPAGILVAPDALDQTSFVEETSAEAVEESTAGSTGVSATVVEALAEVVHEPDVVLDKQAPLTGEHPHDEFPVLDGAHVATETRTEEPGAPELTKLHVTGVPASGDLSIEEPLEPSTIRTEKSNEDAQPLEAPSGELEVQHSAEVVGNGHATVAVLDAVQEKFAADVPVAEATEPPTSYGVFAEPLILNVSDIAPSGTDDLVLLSSSSETCLADPQVDDEPVHGDSAPTAEDKTEVVEKAEETVSISVSPTVAEETATEHDTSASIDEQTEQSTAIPQEAEEIRAEVDAEATIDPVAEQNAGDAEPKSESPGESVGVKETPIPHEAIEAEAAAVKQQQTHVDSEIIEPQATVSPTRENGTIPIPAFEPSPEDVKATHEEDTAQATLEHEIQEIISSVTKDVIPPEAETNGTAVSTETEVEVTSEEPEAVEAEATIPGLPAAAAGVTLLVHEEATVCKSEEEIASESELKPETSTQPDVLEPEVPTPVIAVTAEDIEQPSAQVEAIEVAVLEAEAERPKSPWTPSYSVTTQGSGTQVADDSEELASLEKLPPAGEQQATVEAEINGTDDQTGPSAATSTAKAVDSAVSTAGEAPKNWSLSYSVSSQGASPLQTPQLAPEAEAELESIEQLPPKVVVDEVEVSNGVPVVVQEVQVSVPESEALVTDDSVEPPAIVTTDESDVSAPVPELSHAEEPAEEATAERPWTPSYSVSQQGSTPSQTPKELEPEGPDVAAQQVLTISTPEVEHPVGEHPERPWTPSYSVAHVGASPSSVHKELDTAAGQLGETAEEPPADHAVQSQPAAEPAESREVPPEQSYTPSYAVTQQGNSPLLVQRSLEETVSSELPSVVPVGTESSQEVAPERPWTPSYSVSQQGSSPLLAAKPLEENSTPESSVDQAPSNIATEDAAPERPWTPSYSVSRQGSSPRIEAKALETSSPAELTPDAVATNEQIAPERPWTPSYSVSHQGTSPKLAAAELVDTESADIPQRPWTPSYSVSRQGSSPLPVSQDLPDVSAEGAEVRSDVSRMPEIHVEQVIEASAVETHASHVETVASQQASDDKPSTWVSSYSVSRQGSPSGSPAIQTKELEPPEVKIDTEDVVSKQTVQSSEPERPWTPSYSVITQGPSTEPSTEAAPQVFPTTEIADNAPASKPNLSHLVPVNEQTLDASAAESVSPPTRRARLESTASSRFFPGGWFSGHPKSPEDNRASLDHATGEFSRLESAVSPSLDVPANTPIEGEPIRKRGWCLVM